MSERVAVPCLECGAEIEFEVEPWADPPERAFCGEKCYEAAEPEVRAEARASQGN